MKKLLITLLLCSTCYAQQLPFTTSDGKWLGLYVPSAASWTDPNASALALRMWFDPSANKLIDSSSKADTYSLVGSPSWETIGTNANARIKSAYNFTTTQYMTGRVVAVNTAVTNVTVACWFKMRSYESSYTTILTSGGLAPVAIGINNFNTGPFFQFSGADYGIYNNAGYASVIPTNVWHHMVYQWAKDGNYALWINTTNRALTKVGATNSWTQGAPFEINFYPSYHGIDGWISDIRVYTNYSFTQADVGNLYTNTFKPNGDIEVGY